jgi:hypothetical protein
MEKNRGWNMVGSGKSQFYLGSERISDKMTFELKEVNEKEPRCIML